MGIAEQIEQYVERLPGPMQEEVLSFAEFLVAKVEAVQIQEERAAWSAFSLASAMRGMEKETTPTYAISDLKEVF